MAAAMNAINKILLKTRGCFILSPLPQAGRGWSVHFKVVKFCVHKYLMNHPSWEGWSNLWKHSIEQLDPCECIAMAKGAPAAFHSGLNHF